MPNMIVKMTEKIAGGMFKSWTLAIPLQVAVSHIRLHEGGCLRESEICNDGWLVELQSCRSDGVEGPAEEEEPDLDIF